MPRKTAPKPKPANPEEYKRFLETAKTVEADEDPRSFDKAFKKVVLQPKTAGQ